MIQRIFTIVVLLSLQLFAQQYNSTLLDIEAKLFPKMLVLEKHIKEKESSDLTIVILSQEFDINTAKKLKVQILKNYPNKLLNKKVVVKIKSPHDTLEKNVDGIIVLYNTEEIARNIASWANKHKIITLSYDASYLEYGILGSIYIGKTTKPYLNSQVIKEHGFIFDAYLLQLSKFKK